uniref:gliding motility lipoprotein GldB n=1 Tax=uncultured Draconibacterium sp. TaxID=1573823 RepID=UPI003216C71E
MKLIKLLFLLVVFATIFFACKHNPLKVDISNIDTEVEVVRFDEGLFSINDKDTLKAFVELSNEYPDFFNLYTYRILQIGGINDEHFADLMKAFITDTMILDVKAKTDREFSDYKKLEKQLKKAFKYYSYYFPNNELPTIYTYVSGFNQSVVTAENIIGISLDKYLGRDCEYYQQLSTTPQYKVQNMHKNKILSDVAFAWGITEFEKPNTATNLMSNMVQKGKLMYLVDAMLPDMPDSLKIGYTTQQLEWCQMNEPQMWTYIIEKEMLYSSKRMNIIRYINDSPSTSGFPLDSPGRTGVWIGWQIVRQYMKKHPEITLSQLMANYDYQKILNQSGYNPE